MRYALLIVIWLAALAGLYLTPRSYVQRLAGGTFLVGAGGEAAKAVAGASEIDVLAEPDEVIAERVVEVGWFASGEHDHALVRLPDDAVLLIERRYPRRSLYDTHRYASLEAAQAAQPDWPWDDMRLAAPSFWTTPSGYTRVGLMIGATLIAAIAATQIGRKAVEQSPSEAPPV